MDALKIEIYGDIGYRYYDWINDEYVGVDFKFVESQIKNFDGDQIKVYINSFGGSVLEGIAIYNLLVGHKAKVTTYVVGYAISMGSVIFMAGDEREIPSNGWLMIHEASMYTQGDSDSLERDSKLLNTMSDQIASIYSKKSTKYNKNDFRKFMKEETWITGTEAKNKYGLATKTTAGVSIAAQFGKEDFKNMPQGVIDIINQGKEGKMDFKQKYEALSNKVKGFFKISDEQIDDFDFENALKSLSPSQDLMTFKAKFDEGGEYSTIINNAAAKLEETTAQLNSVKEKMSEYEQTIKNQAELIETYNQSVKNQDNSIENAVKDLQEKFDAKVEAIKNSLDEDVATKVAENIEKEIHNAGNSIVDKVQDTINAGIKTVKLSSEDK